MNIGWPQYEKVRQQIMLPDEGIFLEVKRYWSWQMPDTAGWSFVESTAFACPVCFKTWAVLLFDTSEPRFITSCCLQHRGQGKPRYDRFDASIIPDIGAPGYGLIDFSLLEALPPELLKREALIHLQQAEREIEHDSTRSRAAA